MYAKEMWSSLPAKLQCGVDYDCRVDCEAVAMAYAESKSMMLVTKTRDA
eukprot:COSAG02_NODE_40385_length_406_cov_0.785016_1_plen_48_part_10